MATQPWSAKPTSSPPKPSAPPVPPTTAAPVPTNSPDAHWANHRPGYRCRHGHTSSQRRTPGQPKNLYRREDHLLDQLTAHLTSPDGTAALHEKKAHPDDVVGYLRNNDLITICDEKGWTAHIDPA